MPRGDRTGPNGEGQMTGRGLGYCSGFNTPGFANACFGRGFVWRARNMQFPFQQQPETMTKKQEKEYLKQEIRDLKEETEEIQKRLKEIDS